jgi:hypothetical protein
MTGLGGTAALLFDTFLDALPLLLVALVLTALATREREAA